MLLFCIFQASALYAAETTTFSYDALGRLIRSGKTGGFNDGVVATTGFDAAGNRVNYAVSRGGNAGGIGCSVSINDNYSNEGNFAEFTITRSGSCSGSFSVNFATAPDTAEDPGDYISQSGTITFTPSSASTFVVSIELPYDGEHEPYKTYFVNLSSVTSDATIGDGQGVGRIRDDT